MSATRSPLNRIARSSVKDQALDQLKAYIASGSVASGHRLPSERELANVLGIGRNSVREALKILETIGIVESRVGEGTFIVDQTGASFGGAIGLSLATWGGALVEILTARRMFEVATAAAAAEHRDAQDLIGLDYELTRMLEAGDAAYDYLAADMQFHRLVARATHNTIVEGIVGNLIDMLEAVLAEAHADQIMTLAEGSGTHQDIFVGIERRDPAAASAAMRRHLQFSKELWAAVTSLSDASRGGESPASTS